MSSHVDTTSAASVADLLGLTAAPSGPAARSTTPVDPVDALLRTAENAPSRIAVVDGNRTVTYGELADAARRIATELTGHGVGAGERVAVLTDRGADTVIAVVGTLLAGAAYVPIDPTYPAARITRTVTSARPSAIIRDGLQIEYVEHAADAPTVPADLAYVIYTSGSTGEPKGVMVTRANLAAMLGATLPVLHAAPDDVWTWSHSHAFDFSVFEIFGALASGGSVVVVNRDTALDPARLGTLIDARGVTILSQTPSAFGRLTDPVIAAHSGARLDSLRWVVFGGEALDPPSLRGWARAHPATRLLNMYGITETTVHLTHTLVDVEDARSVIGEPLDGMWLGILDADGRELPVGARGELYVAGPQVSAGYLDRPDLTAQRFVPAPWSADERMYRTGDIVRRLSETTFEYLGRDDEQLQIRGFRVELGEITNTLRSLPGVADVRVLSLGDETRGGAQGVAAFVTGYGAAELDAERLESEAARLLPGHLLPNRIVPVPVWPLTETGKLDHAALRARLRTPEDVDAAQLTGEQQQVADAMSAVIDPTMFPETLTSTANFFAVGGNSLSAARLAARLSATGHAVTVADVFANPRIDQLAALLTGSADASVLPSITEHRTEPDHLPLTPEQQDLWLRWRTDPTFTGYLLSAAFPIPAGVSSRRLRGAVRAILSRHEALRTSFPVDTSSGGGAPYQRLWSAEEIGDPLADATVEVSDVDAALDALTVPFDLASELPWRIRLVSHGDQFWLLAVVHHIVTDGESLAALSVEFDDAVSGGAHRADPDFGSDTDRGVVDYRQYTLWRYATLEARREELVDYWRSLFTTPIEILRMPGVDLRAPRQHVVHSRVCTLGVARTAALAALVVERQSSEFIAVHTALAAVLARRAGVDVVTIGTAVSGRWDEHLPAVQGLFARAIPLRTEVDVELSFGELLARITRRDLDAFAHAELPLDEIAAIADPGRRDAGVPLFDVMLAEVVSTGGGGPTSGEVGAPLYGLDVTMTRVGDSLQLTMTCDSAVADAGTLAALCESVVGVLDAVVDNPEAPVATHLSGALPAAPNPQPAQTLAELLLTHVADRPDAVAVRDGRSGLTLTNSEFDALSTALARQLISLGVGPDATVALHLPRSVAATVATLAAAKAGAAFVNIDPDYPAARRRLLVQRSHARVVVTTRDVELPELDDVDVLSIDDVATAADLAGPGPFAPVPLDAAPFDVIERVRPLHPDDIAYVSFTSGTTGEPKAVQISHRGLASWARSTAARLDLTRSDRVMHTHPVGFDAHLMGLVPVRVAGATSVICPPDVVAGAELQQQIAGADVIVLLATPSVLATLSVRELPCLSGVVVGGEHVPAAVVAAWSPYVAVTNEYGPTEATVAVTSANVAGGEQITIGTPLPGVVAIILDAALRPLPDDTVGELYLVGDCLARGYLDAPASTSGAFVASVLGDGGRMYRTGDLVHRRSDGSLIIHGRTDDQRKVRGIRIEPGEIDAALLAVDGIAAAATDVRPGPSGEKVVVSWVVVERNAAGTPEQIRAEVATRLPRALVPADIQIVDDISLSRNGKLDTTRLPDPLFGMATTTERHHRPRTATEVVVAKIWAEVLDIPVDVVGTDSDFFGLGGSSLSATRVVSRLSEQTGRDVALTTLFDARTVARLARSVDELVATAGHPVPTHRPIPANLPLSYPQRRMWIHNRVAPQSTAYHMPVVLRIDGELDPGRLVGAIDAAVNAHQSLRTIFPDTPDGARQRVLDTTADTRVPTLQVVGVEAHDLGKAMADLVGRPFDLTVEAGFRAALFDTESGTRMLVLVCHHVAVDGWSMRLLLDEILHAYRGSQLPTERFTYADFTTWQIERLGDPDDPSSRYTRQLDHWITRLRGVDAPVRIPGLREKARDQGGRLTRQLDPDAVAGISATAERLSASTFHAVHAAVAWVLGSWTGRDDLVVGTPVHGRIASQWESVVGMFVNTVALRTALATGTSIADAISHARDTALDALDNSEVPYDTVARAVRPDADAGADPLISVLLVNQDVLLTHSDVTELDGGVPVELLDSDHGLGAAVDAKYDVEVVVAGTELIVAHSGRVPQAVAAALLDDVVAVLDLIAREPDGVLPRVAAPPVEPSPLLERQEPVVGRVQIGSDPQAELQPAGERQPLTEDVAANIVAAMAAVLNRDPAEISVDDDFFMLGGTSLSATQVTAVLRESFGMRVETRLLFETPSARGLAGAVSASTPQSTPMAPRSTRPTLAPTQRRMWVVAQLDEDSGSYAVPVMVPVPAHTDQSQVRDAVHELIGRHAALRTGYAAEAGAPVVHDRWTPTIERLDTAEITADVVGRIINAPFDFDAGPPVRASILVEHGRPVALLVVAHHVALDGESVHIIEDELTALLSGRTLPVVDVDFPEVAHRLAADEARDRAELVEYWTSELSGYPGSLALTADRPAVRSTSTTSTTLDLDDDASAAIARSAHDNRVSTFHVLHAALALTLSAQAATDDVAVATPVSMRRDPAWRDVVGMLVSTVVLRTRIRPEMTVGELLTEVRDHDLTAIDHALLGFDEVVTASDTVREPGRHPLVQVLLSVTTGAVGDPADLPSPPSDYDLQVSAVQRGDRWQLTLVYARDLFDDRAIDALQERLASAVAVVTGDQTRRLGQIDLLTAAKRAFVARHAAVADPTTPVLAADILQYAVDSGPDLLAVDDGEEALTYREFDDWISVTARALRERGHGPHDRVALLIPRSIELVVAWWALSRIGATPVHVDVTYPRDRIDAVLEVSGAAALSIDDLPARPAEPVVSEPITRVSADSLAYIITTSGTTGTPNAVGVTHRGLPSLTRTETTASDRVAMIASPAFDATLFEQIVAFGARATLTVAPVDVVAGTDLTAWLAAHGVTVFFATPSVVATLDATQLHSLRTLYIGGEAVPADLVDRWSSTAHVFTVYGPTETTVIATGVRHRAGGRVQIGRPLDGTGAVVLDSAMRPVRPGAVGELYLLGARLARGYIGARQLTATRFVAALGGARMYRTGDLVRWDVPDGCAADAVADATAQLVYVGRADRQIKIRGQRVEPAEIDAVLLHAGAEQSVTVPQRRDAGTILVSYVVAGRSAADDLLAHCRKTLPRHMVPTRIIVVDELPRTGVGKVDTRSLPEPARETSRRAPQSAVQRAVVEAFGTVLGSEVGLDDDFFASGGNSLLLLGLRDELSRRLDWTPPVTQLFSHSTPAEIAELVESPQGHVDEQVIELSRDASLPALWCVHAASGLAVDYQPLAEALPAYQVLGLQLPGLADLGATPFTSIESLAALHVEAIRHRQPHGPYRLLGWSVGGVIAHEISRQLTAAGERVERLILLDPRMPAELRHARRVVDIDESTRSALYDADTELAARYERQIEALIEATRVHRPGHVSVGRAVYLAASDNPSPREWSDVINGDYRVIAIDSTHADFGESQEMRRIGGLLDAEL